MTERETPGSFVSDPYRLVWLALAIFPLHVAEEVAGGFVGWFNGLVDRPINLPLFMTVNGICMAITVVTCGGSALTKSRNLLSVGLGWLALLMFGNGIFHITGTLLFERYSPGTVSAVLLYIPYFLLLLRASIRAGQVNVLPFLATFGLIGTPGMIHLYRVLFEGRRLF